MSFECTKPTKETPKVSRRTGLKVWMKVEGVFGGKFHTLEIQIFEKSEIMGGIIQNQVEIQVQDDILVKTRKDFARFG